LFSSLPNFHPLLVHFPVALFTAAFVLDTALVARFRVSWLDRSALLLYALAFVTSLATAVSGKLSADALSSSLSESALDVVGSHGDWAFLTVLLFFGALVLRLDVTWRGRGAPSPRIGRARLAALALALVAELGVLTTAGLGGELVYRYGVGVSSQPDAEAK
jgi:uncharacterized membrane protein